MSVFIHSIIMSEKTLKFNNIKINKKEFHKSKVTKTLLVIKKTNLSNHYVISYLKWMVTENGGKNRSFLIKNDEVRQKYENIWNVIKNKVGNKFNSGPIYGNKYLKAKVREFDGDIKTNFLNNGLPKENTYYTFIASIAVDSVRMNSKYE